MLLQKAPLAWMWKSQPIVLLMSRKNTIARPAVTLMAAARHAVEGRQVGVEPGNEGLARAKEQQAEDDQQAGHPDVEAELLDPGVPLHAHADKDEDDKEHQQNRGHR